MRFWYQKNSVSHGLRPLAWIYRAVVAARRGLYRSQIKKTHQFSVPVVVVGNITVGGTGKTPLVIALVNRLKREGFRPGIVSRGYGGRAKIWPQMVSDKSDPREVGDEPVMIVQRTECPMVVAPNRVAAVTTLLADYDCDIVISDDGLQHYALARDIEIAVIDGARRLGNGYCLPAGPLCEPAQRMDSVDFVVVNGPAQSGEFAMELKPGEVYNLGDSEKQWNQEEALQCEKPLHAVVGIGHPQRFFESLKNLGLDFIPHVFADHHQYTQQDIDFGEHENVIMTEKDAVKCRQFADQRHWCLPVTANLDEQWLSEFFLKLGDVQQQKKTLCVS